MQNEIIKRLTLHPCQIGDGDEVYRLEELKAVPGVTVTQLVRGIYFAIHIRDGIFISVAAFEASSGDERGNDFELRLLFHGNGVGGGLRELRYMNWGEGGNGHLYYMPIAGVLAAVRELHKHFED